MSSCSRFSVRVSARHFGQFFHPIFFVKMSNIAQEIGICERPVILPSTTRNDTTKVPSTRIIQMVVAYLSASYGCVYITIWIPALSETFGYKDTPPSPPTKPFIAVRIDRYCIRISKSSHRTSHSTPPPITLSIPFAYILKYSTR